jgi:hypothetical protein
MLIYIFNSIITIYIQITTTNITTITIDIIINIILLWLLLVVILFRLLIIHLLTFINLLYNFFNFITIISINILITIQICNNNIGVSLFITIIYLILAINIRV